MEGADGRFPSLELKGVSDLRGGCAVLTEREDNL